jgi:putative acetyltransferase
MNAFLIRAEAEGDAPAIAALHEAAFDNVLEARLVEQLRAEDELLVSLVAEDDSGAIVGHIALSPAGIAQMPDIKLLWLAPLAVRPDRQRQGIGAALVGAAADTARAAQIDGVIVLGAPEYYGRFGFESRSAGALASRFEGPSLQLLRLSRAPADLAGELVEPLGFAVFG